MAETIRISVRSLVEFLLRSGDLDRSKGGWAERDAMAAGSRIHRKIQKAMGSGYTAEAALKLERQYDSYTLVLEGRADGIFSEEGRTVIDEIKGIYHDPELMEEPVAVHLAQARCYAYIYALQHQLDVIGVQMTYCSLETETVRRFRYRYSFGELEEWMEDILEQYRKWAEFRVEWKKIRDASLKDLAFPFSYRPGQKDLVRDIYVTFLRRRQIFIQAPTGVGKTISAVYPAVKALGEGVAEKIFYLTAKTVTGTVAEEAFRTLETEGMRLKHLAVTARDKMCILDEQNCTAAGCPRAEGHYDRIRDCLYEMITACDRFDRETILAMAEKYCVCPAELSLELADFSDAVIGDYNYVFDPNARLRRYFGETAGKGEYLFLIDEAHNLVERGRDMFSAALCKEDFLELRRTVKAAAGMKAGSPAEVKAGSPAGTDAQAEPDEGRPEAAAGNRNSIMRDPAFGRLVRALEHCNRTMLSYKRECDTLTRFPGIGDLMMLLPSLIGALEDCLSLLREGPLRTQMLEFYFRVREFSYIHDLADDRYLIYGAHGQDHRFYLKLFCVNPAGNLQNCLDRGRSAVLLSATLLPVNYYRSLLSTREDDYAVYIPSPFPAGNRLICVAGDVSSRYTRRTDAEYSKYADYIHVISSAKRGNYIVFFPSYKMMSDVQAAYEAKYGSAVDGQGRAAGGADAAAERGAGPELAVQSASMTEAERRDFLERFTDDSNLLGFCVMGGIFGEGIDLAGKRLIGAVIVGTGIPQIGPERDLLRDYYDGQDKDPEHGGQNYKMGFDYAYRCPGMNKVLQAAGRVIRTAEDKGVIFLLDERFRYSEYQSLFPREWEDRKLCTLKTAPALLETFWKGK